jgi:hypothetical protein
MDVVSRGADVNVGVVSVTMGDECGFDIDMDILACPESDGGEQRSSR